VFSRPLSNTKVTEGGKVLLECHVTGSPAPRVTWSVEGAELASSAEVAITQHGVVNCLVISEVLCEDEGQYTVSASNVHGSASTTAYLTVVSE